MKIFSIPDFFKPSNSLFDLTMQAKQSPALTSNQFEALRSVTNAQVDQQIQKIKNHSIHPC